MKMILKVLALPVLFVVTIACILGNLITNISSYVIALLLLIIAGCSIYCIIKALWTSLVILAGMGLANYEIRSENLVIALLFVEFVEIGGIIL